MFTIRSFAPIIVWRQGEGAPDTTAPILTLATGVASGSTASTGSVTTNEAGGTLYWVTTTSASESGPTVKAGFSQSVSASGLQSITTSSLTASTTYRNHFLHSDAAGNDSAVLSSVTFTTDAATSPPTVLTNPSSQSVVSPATATFTGSASGTGMSYQWQRNGSNISGATSASYTTGATTVTGGSHNNGDTYRFVATNAGGSVTSSSATLTVSAAPVPVLFSGAVPNQATFVGATFSLSLTPYFSGTYTPLTYAVIAGTLPAGLSLVGGVISGVPTTAQIQAGIQVRATDSASNTATTNAVLFSVAASAIPISQVSAIPRLDARVGVPFSYDLSQHYTGTATPFTYAVVGGRLPDGLTLSGSIISGTPTTSENHIVESLQIAVTDAG